jgi:hypothetical protein
LTRTVITNFPADAEMFNQSLLDQLSALVKELMDDYLKNSKLKETMYARTGKMIYREYYVRQSKPIIDEIDDFLAKIYGLNPKETEYIKNYESVFRLGIDD